MADETTGGQPLSDPGSGWPAPPDGGHPPASAGGGAPPPRPPWEPPSGWAGARPAWAERTGSGGTEGPSGPSSGPLPRSNRLAGLRGRRRLAVVAAAVLLLVGAGIAVAVLTSGDDAGQGKTRGAGGGGNSTAAPAAAAGGDLTLLDGRLVVTAPPGWEQRESSADTATVKVELRLPGRELVATLVAVALPGGGSPDSMLTVDQGARFEVSTKDGPILATAVSSSGNVRAIAARPRGTFYISLSVFALDGTPLDVATLQKLFTDQVAPQLRFP